MSSSCVFALNNNNKKKRDRDRERDKERTKEKRPAMDGWMNERGRGGFWWSREEQIIVGDQIFL